MSMFQIPEVPGARTLEKMNEEMSSKLQNDLQNAANLLAHPAAGMAAASALGIGLANHSFGIWMGVVAGATEATQRLFAPLVGDVAGDVNSFAEKKEAPAKRAEVAAKALIEDTKRKIKKAAEKAEKPAAPKIAEQPDPAALQAAPEAIGPVAPGVEAVAPAPAIVEAPPMADAPTELLPEDFRQPKAAEKPETLDDLKAISGIGPKLENVLNGLGVWTFAQIAAWTPAEVAWVDDTLGFKGRIGRDDWIGQAVLLTKNDTRQ